VPVGAELRASENARRLCERAYQSAPALRPSTGFGNSSADNQISPSSQFAETIHRLAVGFGCDNLEAPRAQQAKRRRQAGGSLRDVQLLAGHASITTTQRYIEGDSDAQRKLVSLL
jgi:integrase/recombinase XerD